MDTFAPGSIFSHKYRIDVAFASGGFGTVYHATDLLLLRLVALKIFHNVADGDARALIVQRFAREARVSNYFTANPHIITVYDLAQIEDGSPYLVLEYIEGGSLAKMLQRDGRLEPHHACTITSCLFTPSMTEPPNGSDIATVL